MRPARGIANIVRRMSILAPLWNEIMLAGYTSPGSAPPLLEQSKMPDYRTLDYVRCRQFLESRSAGDDQIRNIKMFVDNWAALVLASETQNYIDHKRALDRLDALASRAAAERLQLLG